MPQISGIYDSAWIQPICKVGENISVMTIKQYSHFRVKYIEPIPAGPASTVDMVLNAGATQIAANATIQRAVIAVLQLNESEFLHLRWEPLDNVEGVLWELSGTQKFGSRSIHARTDRLTRTWDPHLASTTFWILGQNHDMQLEVRNAMGYALPAARFVFYGYRYVLEEIDLCNVPQNIRNTMKDNSLSNAMLDAVKKYIGHTTFVPAEGLMA